MKNFIKYGLFGILFITLFGCGTEMRETFYFRQNVEDITINLGSWINYKTYFYATSTDSNGVTKEIECAGSVSKDYDNYVGGYYYLVVVSGNIEAVGDCLCDVYYFPGGQVYNWNQQVSDYQVVIHVKEPTIDHVEIIFDRASPYLQGLTWEQNIDKGWIMGKVGIYASDDSYGVDLLSPLVTLTGIDENTPPGIYPVTATFLGVTSEPVAMVVVADGIELVETHSIKYYDNSVDLNLEPSLYTNIDSFKLPKLADKTGYTFDWWIPKDASGDIIADVTLDKIPYGTSLDLHLYANWIKNQQ